MLLTRSRLLLGRRSLAAWTFGAVAAVAAVWPATADARVVTSEDAMFSVDVGAATICFVEPRSASSDEDCAGVDAKDFPVAPVADPLARLAYGIVRGAGQGASRPVLGVVSVMRAPSHATAPPNDVTAVQVGEEASESVAASLPAGARLLPQASKIAWSKDVPVVRTTLVVEGLEAGSNAELNGHREVVTAIGGRHVYITVWSGSREHGSELARLADAAATTIDLKPEARPVTKLNPWPGRLLFAFGVLGLMLLRFRQKKKKKAAASKPPAR
jgi:hypothetical protein